MNKCKLPAAATNVISDNTGTGGQATVAVTGFGTVGTLSCKVGFSGEAISNPVCSTADGTWQYTGDCDTGVFLEALHIDYNLLLLPIFLSVPLYFIEHYTLVMCIIQLQTINQNYPLILL